MCFHRPRGAVLLGCGVHLGRTIGARVGFHIEDVKSIDDSPHRLPARFATELYATGESVMGKTFFTVVFADGSSESYVTGNAVDFIRYPGGKGPADVVRVIPHEGSANISQPWPQYCWCLYSESLVLAKQKAGLAAGLRFLPEQRTTSWERSRPSQPWRRETSRRSWL